MTKLTNTQAILLSTAARREGGSILPLPDTITAPKPAIAKSIASLIQRGFAEERETDVAVSVHRSDGDLRYGVFATARRWWAELRQGEIDITRLAARETVTPSYMTRIVRLAFVSPAAVDAILAGTQRAGVSAKMLTQDAMLPVCWNRQRVMLLPAE